MSRLYGSRWPELGPRSPIDDCCEEFLYFIKPPAGAGGQAGRFAAGRSSVRRGCFALLEAFGNERRSLLGGHGAR